MLYKKKYMPNKIIRAAAGGARFAAALYICLAHI